MTKACMCLIAGALLCTSPALAEKAGNETMTIAKYNDSDSSMFQLRKPEVMLDLKEKHEYYNVRGNSFAELRKQMKENGTRWNDDQTYAALTTWDIKYNYDINEDNGRYSIGSVRTKVDIVYRYPRLASLAGIPEPILAGWKNYMDRVTFHEIGHKDIAAKAASDMNDLISSLGSFDSKRELRRTVDKVVEARLKQLKEDQIKYDADTHHGELQGAILK